MRKELSKKITGGISAVNYIQYADLAALLFSLIGMVLAVITLLKHYKIMYLRMICWGVICAFFARLFHVVVMLLFHQVDFNISMATMGVFGSLLFLLSANFGQIDGLVDDGSRRAKKTRLIALIGPLLIIAMYAYYIISLGELDIMLSAHINVAVVGVVILPCIYFNFKHLIIYDVEGGIVRSLRPYNALAVLYELLVMAEWIALHMGFVYTYSVTLVVQGIILLCLVPAAGRGVKKWTI